jgi:hypothetical protein
MVKPVVLESAAGIMTQPRRETDSPSKTSAAQTKIPACAAQKTGCVRISMTTKRTAPRRLWITCGQLVTNL